MEHYLARIAFEICRGNAKDPNKVRLQDFIIPLSAFKMDRERTPIEKTLLVKASKQKWLGMFGIKAK